MNTEIPTEAAILSLPVHDHTGWAAASSGSCSLGRLVPFASIERYQRLNPSANRVFFRHERPLPRVVIHDPEETLEILRETS